MRMYHLSLCAKTNMFMIKNRTKKLSFSFAFGNLCLSWQRYQLKVFILLDEVFITKGKSGAFLHDPHLAGGH